MKALYGSLIICISFSSCVNNNTPRLAKNKNLDNNWSNSITFAKKIFSQEDKKILKYLEDNDLSGFERTHDGFWFRIEGERTAPSSKSEVIIEYSVLSMNGDEVYEKRNQSVLLNKTDIIQGLNDGLKLMNEGEIFTFIFPSYKAYGLYGDGNKVLPNTSLMYKVTLLKILN
ncbi:FKBP-type peptidyl-prolyl cis-trans isomerase [Ichthyobacterium seriolicida]|uniref:Peptidyl-prolyl cis-trans isomerase n=1 Tax=Ichthyobacterium seriolicida TaxID=242600 RepID=A0A1J1EAH4_9FLAO|nr:FKBP-type peptidyl-prolyl cis-trans isomerase [Ichthyobacterium seriolicida]BAV94939.1 gliding motility protein GldI [Ichthyobacterium seriolicida]